jgi:hypothetical protein
MQCLVVLFAYVLLETLYEEGNHHRFIQRVSFVSFTRQLIEA